MLLVDDHELLRDGLRRLLESDDHNHVCGEASTVADAKRMIVSQQPELVFVDIQLPGESGLELIRWISQTHPKIKTIVATMFDESVYGQRALREGANGYVCKSQAPQNLREAVKVVMSGAFYFSEELTQQILRDATCHRRSTASSPVDALSNRELEILALLGAGKTSEVIAEELFISRNTVGTYRERLKAKLKLKNCNELVHFAIHWVDRSTAAHKSGSDSGSMTA